MHYLIFYYKDMTKVLKVHMDKGHTTVDEIKDTHVLVGSLVADTLDDVFNFMQGFNWSPDGQARELIGSLDTHHTSMSVGDIAYSIYTGIYYQCEDIGWKIIGEGSQLKAIFSKTLPNLRKIAY